MIANPDKFKAIILSKGKLNTTDITFNFKGQNISAKKEVDLLGITIDNKLTFETHISSLCCKAAGQLNALKRLSYYIPVETRKILVEAFIFSNFNYCPLVWYFSTAKQINKIERIQERALRFINNDYHLDYSTLLSKNEHVTMEAKRTQFLCTEIYKTLNGLNPNYMNKIFVKSCSRYSSRRPHDLMVPRVNQTKFGLKSIQYEGAKLWNHLPNSIKSAENLEIFKTLIKSW